MLIGVVTARFNSEITFELERGALETLEKSGVPAENIWCVRVPGAVEIPLVAKALLEQGCEAVITLGAVIRGETAHFDYVCQSVERGVTQLMLESGKPVVFGVLTTENEDQAYARTIGHHGNKGSEAAATALEMLGLLHDIKKGWPQKKSSSKAQAKAKIQAKVKAKAQEKVKAKTNPKPNSKLNRELNPKLAQNKAVKRLATKK